MLVVEDLHGYAAVGARLCVLIYILRRGEKGDNAERIVFVRPAILAANRSDC